MKRQLIKEGKIKVIRNATIYCDLDFDFEYTYYLDFEDFVEEMRSEDIIEDTEMHFENCEAFNNYNSTNECKYCPYKEKCKKKEL